MTGVDDQTRVLEHAYRQAVAASKARELAQDLKSGRVERHSEQAVEFWVQLAGALLTSGRITASEYLIYATFGVESLHDRNWLDGCYPEVIELSGKIDAAEKAHGLPEGHYLPKADQPDDVRQLNDEYEAALHRRYEALLERFGLQSLAELWRNDREEYDRRREVGRRSIFEKEDQLTAVHASLAVYEREAESCSSAGAYYAAAVMLGSAAEARLLGAFLRHPQETAAALRGMPRSERPRNSDPRYWGFDHMIAVAERAGWISTIENDFVGARVGPWLSSLRRLRNLLHPGYHLREKPHAIIGPEEYADAKYGYSALCLSLGANLSGIEQDLPRPIEDEVS